MEGSGRPAGLTEEEEWDDHKVRVAQFSMSGLSRSDLEADHDMLQGAHAQGVQVIQTLALTSPDSRASIVKADGVEMILTGLKQHRMGAGTLAGWYGQYLRNWDNDLPLQSFRTLRVLAGDLDEHETSSSLATKALVRERYTAAGGSDIVRGYDCIDTESRCWGVDDDAPGGMDRRDVVDAARGAAGEMRSGVSVPEEVHEARLLMRSLHE